VSSTGKSRSPDRRFLVAGLLVVLLAVAYLMLWRPKSAQIADLRAERTSLEVAVASASTTPGPTAGGGASPTTDAGGDEVGGNDSRLDLAVPSEPQLPALLRSLQSAAGAAGLQAASITIGDPAAGATGAQTVSLGVTAQASQKVAYDYLARLTALDRLLMIDSFDLQDGSLSVAARAFATGA
jgi:Tfp pilus assembly protein PilO